MNKQNTYPLESAANTASTLNQKLSKLHIRILENFDCLDRIAVAMYDDKQDLLKTFINSTRKGEAIAQYEYRLSDSPSLNRLAKEGMYRVVDDIPGTISPTSKHSEWLLKQGYRSSFTVPLYDNGKFLGIIFFDSSKESAFTTKAQRDLLMYSNLINMIISEEIAAIRSIVASAKVAREISNLRDFETGAHLERMARFARIIALELAKSYHFSDEFVEHVYLFAPLHDVGKIGIPDQILMKPGKLTDAERAIMKGHVGKGLELVAKILGDFGLEQLPDSRILTNIIGCHHEFVDGSGYPRGLKGDAIPIEARIISVADIYDALTSVRPYKRAWGAEAAIAELELMVQRGKLDQDCVAALKRRLPDLIEISAKYVDDEAVARSSGGILRDADIQVGG
jgi:HD-GYP domain-containing protein (c-di-GMP phosphodiesterase class II)